MRKNFGCSSTVAAEYRSSAGQGFKSHHANGLGFCGHDQHINCGIKNCGVFPKWANEYTFLPAMACDFVQNCLVIFGTLSNGGFSKKHQVYGRIFHLFERFQYQLLPFLWVETTNQSKNKVIL